jgi:hypothetical protein
MTPKIEKMDMAEFNKLPGSRSQGVKSWQRTALATDSPGSDGAQHRNDRVP